MEYIDILTLYLLLVSYDLLLSICTSPILVVAAVELCTCIALTVVSITATQVVPYILQREYNLIGANESVIACKWKENKSFLTSYTSFFKMQYIYI